MKLQLLVYFSLHFIHSRFIQHLYVTQNVKHKIGRWWVNNVVERIRKEAAVIHNLTYYPGICLDRQIGVLAEIRTRDLSNMK